MTSATGLVLMGGFNTPSGYKQFAFVGLDGRGSTIWTDDGADTLVFAFSRLEAFLGNGNNTVYGSRQSDFIVGNDGNDHIMGGYGDDFISGGGGANFIDGGQGSDTILFGPMDFVRPGPDNDVLIYAPALGVTGRTYISGCEREDILRLSGVKESDLRI